MRFVTECTLGKLAKWLRMAGFDTVYDTAIPDATRLQAISRHPPRTVLTRTLAVYRDLKPDRVFFLTADRPMDQMGLVIRACRLRRRQCRPFTRCLVCNRLVEACTIDEVRELVPEYILTSYDRFQRCPQCLRIFWPGSHRQRGLALIDAWFDNQHQGGTT